MSDPKKRRSVSWAPWTRSTESQETNLSTRSTKIEKFVSWAPIHVENGLQETKLPLQQAQSTAVCFSLDPKKQALDPKKQLTGPPPGPVSAPLFYWELLLLGKLTPPNHDGHPHLSHDTHDGHRPSFCKCALGLLRCRLFAQRRASLMLLRTRRCVRRFLLAQPTGRTAPSPSHLSVFRHRRGSHPLQHALLVATCMSSLDRCFLSPMVLCRSDRTTGSELGT